MWEKELVRVHKLGFLWRSDKKKIRNHLKFGTFSHCLRVCRFMLLLHCSVTLLEFWHQCEKNHLTKQCEKIPETRLKLEEEEEEKNKEQEREKTLELEEIQGRERRVWLWTIWEQRKRHKCDYPQNNLSLSLSSTLPIKTHLYRTLVCFP